MMNCTNLIHSFAKTLLVTLLCTLGVGEMWGGTKRIYFDYSGYSGWPDASAKAIAHTWNSSGSHDYTMTRVAADQYYYYDIDDSYTDICFKREGPNGEDWGWTHSWSIGSNNRFKIKLAWGEYGTDKGKLLPADSNDAIRWAPGSTIDGLIDIHNPHNQAFSFNDPENVNLGTYSVTLAEHTTYQFKILEGTTAYGLDNNVFTADISNYASSTSGYAYRVATAGTGTYIIKWDKSSKKLSVTYPTVTHPNADYVYLYDHEWGFEKQYIHVWNSGSGIAETTWPGTKIPNTTTINGATYYYCTPGDYANFKFSDGTHSNETGDLAQSGNLGKYYKSVNSSWGWHDFTFSVTLNTNEGTINAGNVTSYTFGTGATLPTNVTRPGYYFAGWYANSDFSGERVYSISTTDNTDKIYYAKWENEWTLVGDKWSSWDKDVNPFDNVTTGVGGYTCYIELNLVANTDYSFKLIKHGSNGSKQYYSLASYETMTYSGSHTTGTFASQSDSQKGSCKVISAGAGNYRFTLNYPDMTVTVTYPTSHTVTFGYGTGGSAVTATVEGDAAALAESGKYAAAGKDITFTQTAATGYTFAGWYDSSSGGSAISNMASDNIYDDIAGNISVYAQYTPNRYTITLDKNGGTGSTPASVIATYDSDVLSASIPKPTKAGYYIAGWYTDDDKLVINADGSMASGLSGYTDSDGNWIHDGDVTLYAKWVLMWTIAGNRWNDWSKEDAYVLGNVGNKAGVDTCYVEIELDANTNYNFKLVKRGENSTYWWHALSASQTITYLSGKTTTTFTGQEGENYGYSCTLTSAGAGTYKFILNISAMTVTVIYPESYTVTFGYGTGGSEVTASGSISGSISSGGYVNKDEDITFTQSAATGYTFAGWYDESSGGSAISCMSSDNVYDDIAADIAVYAQYTPNPYTITLDKNSGAGAAVPASVTATYDSPTLATLSANPYRNGYSFNGWYDGEGGSGNLIISTSKTLQPNTDYTDADGNWTHDGDVTLYAKWTLRWAISGSWDSWDADDHLLGNVGRNASSQDTCSVNISLAANTTYAFKVVNWKLDYDGAYTWLALENQGNMSYKTDTVTAAFDTQATTTRDKSCTMRTAGAGTYKFAYNLSDKKVTVTYPTSYTVTFGSGTGGTVTGASGSVSGSITSGQYVAAGENVTFTPSPAVSSTLKGWYNASSGGSAISGMSSSDNVLDAIEANATVYAQWVSSNFVIYRTGDMEDDPRLLEGDVETYAGGKIDKPIEYRMKVRELDKWYTLCLPFTVNAVKVWDDEDKEYYDIEPYYRGTVGGTLMGGHYIIRTPKQATDLPITEFGDWRDPESADGYLPSMNTPYIIQWHMSYFNGKYISFFGAADQTIPTSMTGGVAPIESNVVNVCVNKSMKSWDVTDPYMLDNDYGSGAWLRAKEKGTVRSINPFECYILANSETTERYLAIRRDMHNTDTPTGWDDVLISERKEMINVYTLTGFRVAQYTNCSFNEANARLRAEHANGIYIMNAGNESVKLMIGGK